MPAFSPKFPRSLLRIAGWLSPAALQLHYFPLQLLEGTQPGHIGPNGVVSRDCRVDLQADYFFADRQACGAHFGAVVSSAYAQEKIRAPVGDS